MDAGMLLIRATIGLLLVGHGAQHGLGWFGGYGAEGTGSWLEGFGFRHGRKLAIFLGASEIGIGFLFLTGFLVRWPRPASSASPWPRRERTTRAAGPGYGSTATSTC